MKIKYLLLLAAVAAVHVSGDALHAECPETKTKVLEMEKKSTKDSLPPEKQIHQWAIEFAHPTMVECVHMNHPKEEDVHAVEDWLRSGGFTFAPSQLTANQNECGQQLFYTGTQAQAEHAFKAEQPGRREAPAYDPATSYVTPNGFVIPNRFKGIIEDIRLIPEPPVICKKPVIYLYPPHVMQVKVRLDYDGALTATYPEYRDGWKVTASPDGALTTEDGSTYAYLFWEGESHKKDLNFKDGFIVKASDSVSFLREKLALLGLTRKEYNDFIVFWLPELLKSPYNLIHFSADDYRKKAQLDITPKPDSEIRVFMIFRRLSAPVNFPEQTLTPAKRSGFAVVEWGGAEMP